VSNDSRNVPLGAIFWGTGFRLDTDPKGDCAFVWELDGTIGASLVHVGLLGLHWAMGPRIARDWEVLASVEGDVLAFGHASASLMIGRSF
jgi:hypothetical protein